MKNIETMAALICTLHDEQKNEIGEVKVLVRDGEGTRVLEIRNGEGEEIVSVHLDGRLTYGESYEPDAAARYFWRAMALLWREYPEINATFDRINEAYERQPSRGGAEGLNVS